MDTNDYKILAHLATHGRTTWAELAEMLGLSPPATAERVRRLEQRGVIKGYAALIDPDAVGYELTAFVAVTLERPRDRVAFLSLVDALAEVQECHHMAGEDDYLLKVRCRTVRDLERIVSEQIKNVPGVVRTRTTIVLSTLKETPAVPLHQSAPPPSISPEDVAHGP